MSPYGGPYRALSSWSHEPKRDRARGITLFRGNCREIGTKSDRKIAHLGNGCEQPQGRSRLMLVHNRAFAIPGIPCLRGFEVEKMLGNYRFSPNFRTHSPRIRMPFGVVARPLDDAVWTPLQTRSIIDLKTIFSAVGIAGGNSKAFTTRSSSPGSDACKLSGRST